MPITVKREDINAHHAAFVYRDSEDDNDIRGFLFVTPDKLRLKINDLPFDRIADARVVTKNEKSRLVLNIDTDLILLKEMIDKLTEFYDSTVITLANEPDLPGKDR